MKFIFKTSATMKPYNNKKWWIDSNIIREKRISADSLKDALLEYQKEVKECDYICISKNAMAHKEPMYRDTSSGTPKQVGYVITALADLDDNHGDYVPQYINLWVEIIVVADFVFPEEEA